MFDPKTTANQILTALVKGKFIEMNAEDLDAFAGVEGTGYIWEPEADEEIVVIDHNDDSFVVQIMNSYTGEFVTFVLSTPEFE